MHKFFKNMICFEGESVLGTAGGTGEAPPAAVIPPVGEAGEPPAAVVPPVGDAAASTLGADSWKEALEDDLRNDPALGHINDIGTLAKSYVHSQRQLGSDKIVVPNKYATPEEWRGVFSKLGLPENVEKYGVENPSPEKTDEEFFGDFKQQAFDAGILPQQAQKLFDWYQGKADAMNQNMDDQVKVVKEKAIGELKNEWGEAFDSKVQAARAAVKQFGGAEIVEYLNKTQLGDDPQLIRLFAKIGENLTEDVFTSQAVGNVGLTPDGAKEKIAAIHNDKKHPYWDSKNPGHKAAVEEMQRYYEAQGISQS